MSNFIFHNEIAGICLLGFNMSGSYNLNFILSVIVMFSTPGWSGCHRE